MSELGDTNSSEMFNKEVFKRGRWAPNSFRRGSEDEIEKILHKLLQLLSKSTYSRHNVCDSSEMQRFRGFLISTFSESQTNKMPSDRLLKICICCHLKYDKQQYEAILA